MSDSDDDAAFASADEGELPSPPSESHGATAAPPTQEVKPKVEEKPKVEDVRKKEPEKLKNEAKGKNKKKKKGKNTSKSSSDERVDSKPVKAPQNTKTVETKTMETKTMETKTMETKSAITTEKAEKKEDTKDEDAKTDKPTKSDNKDKTNADTTSVSDNKDKTNSDMTSVSDNNEPNASKASSNIQTNDSTEDLNRRPSTNSSDKERSDKLSPQTPERAEKDVRDDNNMITESPQDETIPRQVDREHTPEHEEVLDKLTSTSESSGGWGWGWGSSLLKTASSSVSTLKNQVGDGFTTLMDTMETTLGAPSPEEMAEHSTEKSQPVEKTEVSEADSKIDRGETTQLREVTHTEKEEEKGSGWFSNISNLVQNTVTEGMGVLETIGTGGLDVMEKIGKKTYSVITEHDPGFRKARQFLGNKGDKPNLSVVLKEAKEEADRKMEREKETEEARLSHFGCLFDDYQGVAHLEALEILSNQSERKVQALLHTMSDECIREIKPQLMKIKDVFEIDENDEEEEHDFVKLVTEQLVELHLGTTPDKLNKTHEKARKWLEDFNGKKTEEEGSDVSREPKEIHKVAIQCLAELTSKSVEQYHKAGELVLLQKDTDTSYLTRAMALASLTQVLCSEVGILATKFVACLNQIQEDEDNGSVVNPLVTNIYLQASNSASYLQDSFQLLLPVLQHAVIQNSHLLQ